MFTLQAIEDAHSKVKSGADFPKYIQELKKMGILKYKTWVIDSHTDYIGEDNFKLSSPSVYDKLEISELVDTKKFKHSLKIHQEGATDYFTFRNHCAETGIENWIVDLDEMTCIYFDKGGNKILIENIPQAEI